MDSRPGRAIPKAIENGTGSHLADARTKRKVPGSYKKVGKCMLRILFMSQKKLYRASNATLNKITCCVIIEF